MKILLVDDHPMVREGIAVMLSAVFGAARITHADCCQSALDAAAAEPFDLALLDLQLPDMPGFVALERMRELHPAMPVVVISGVDDRDTVLKALDLGAKAFIPKTSDSLRVRGALEAVLDGRVYLPEAVIGTVAGRAAVQPKETAWQLTDRQWEVLSLMVGGLPNKLIARRLDIAESTVKIHVSAVLRELRVTSRTQALLAVARANIRLPRVG